MIHKTSLLNTVKYTNLQHITILNTIHIYICRNTIPNTLCHSTITNNISNTLCHSTITNIIPRTIQTNI